MEDRRISGCKVDFEALKSAEPVRQIVKVPSIHYVGNKRAAGEDKRFPLPQVISNLWVAIVKSPHAAGDQAA
jgi:hypothetical protein